MAVDATVGGTVVVSASGGITVDDEIDGEAATVVDVAGTARPTP
jgi:hypothetical protein